MAQAMAHCWIAFSSLLRRGKDPSSFPTALARFAAKRAIAGRPVGHSYNSEDLASAAARGEVTIEGLEDRPTPDDHPWKALLSEKKAFPPSEVAAARIDIPAWLETLPARTRRIAETLATGEKPSVVAREHGLSYARISQLRAALAKSWQQFQAGASDHRAVAVG